MYPRRKWEASDIPKKKTQTTLGFVKVTMTIFQVGVQPFHAHPKWGLQLFSVLGSYHWQEKVQAWPTSCIPALLRIPTKGPFATSRSYFGDLSFTEAAVLRRNREAELRPTLFRTEFSNCQNALESCFHFIWNSKLTSRTLAVVSNVAWMHRPSKRRKDPSKLSERPTRFVKRNFNRNTWLA